VKTGGDILIDRKGNLLVRGRSRRILERVDRFRGRAAHSDSAAACFSGQRSYEDEGVRVTGLLQT